MRDRLCVEKEITRTEFVILGGVGNPDVDVRKRNLEQACFSGQAFQQRHEHCA